LPDKGYRVTYVPPQVTGRDFKIDNNGSVFSVNSVATGRFSSSNTFYIYRPGRSGGRAPGVQRIPGPATPNAGSFSLVAINQKEQFVCSESAFGDDHRFLWDGNGFVELRAPPPYDNPAPIPGWPGLLYSDPVHPQGILDDGSVWGIADSVGDAGLGDYGGEVQWNLGENPTVTFPFRGNDDPMRLGLGPNQKRHFLRTLQTDFFGSATAFGIWDGFAPTFQRSASIAASSPLRMNDSDEVAGVEDASGQAWIDLPSANHGLPAGHNLLAGPKSGAIHGILFNNRAQLVMATDDPDAPWKLWQNGTWYNLRIHDPTDPTTELSGLPDMNHLGVLLAFVHPKGQIGASSLAVLTPEDLTVTTVVSPAELTMPEEFDLQLTIRNNLEIPLKNVGIVTSSMFFTGAVVADWVKAPGALLSLGAGQTGTLHYGFRSKAPGTAQIRFQVEGQNAAGVRVTLTESLASPNVVVNSDVKGDLLIRRDDEPDAFLALNDVYQTVAIGAQARTNYTITNLMSQFQVQIQNDGKKPATFRLNAVESTNQGWAMRYVWEGHDITAEVRTFAGATLPPLETNKTYSVTVQATPTNAVPGAGMRATLALATTNNPSLTLDVVDAVVRVLPELVVNSTGDLPDQDPEDCCCDTGKRVADQSPECTLRAAIQAANALGTPAWIRFAIEDSPHHRADPAVIEPGTLLPDIRVPLVIEGHSQTGSADETPGVVLCGRRIPDPGGDLAGMAGLTVRSDGGAIYGLAISEFPDFGIHLMGAGNTIVGCFIGTDETGTVSRANGVQAYFPGDVSGGGIWVEGPANIIGSRKHGNLISGLDHAYFTLLGGLEGLGSWLTGFGTAFTGPGIYLGPSAHETVILNNLIETDASGVARITGRDARMLEGI
jgi:CSLREA domain-containing protein